MLPVENRSGRVVCLLGMALACFGLGTSYLSQFWIVLDVFSHFTLHFVIAIIAFATGFFMRSRKVATAMLLMIAGVVAIGLWAHTAERELVSGAPTRDGQRELKVVAFNTWKNNHDLQAITAEVLRLDADVVVMVEYGPNKQSIGAMLRATYPYQFPNEAKWGALVSMFSKYPLTNTRVQGPWHGPVYVRGQLGPEWGGVTILGTHLIRPPYFNAQREQLKYLVGVVNLIEGPKIVMGDFNATPYSVMIRSFKSETGMQRLTSLPTWPAIGPRLPQLAIDHIFVDPSIKSNGTAVSGRFAGSDHLPVGAVLVLPTTGRVTELELLDAATTY